MLAALYRVAFEVAHFLGVFHLKFDMFRGLGTPLLIASIAGVPVLAVTAVATFSSARSPESSRIFDQQDKFFLPYAEFKARLRPGPDIRIYHRLPDSH